MCVGSWSHRCYRMSDINIVVSLRSSRWKFWWKYGEMAVSNWLLGIRENSLSFYMGYMYVHSFQPWLIGENLQNVKNNKVELVSYLRFVHVLGLLAYLLFLNLDEKDLVN
ncbi:unnamed protein product [Eruca vesicaria subsp. sativa]|uniref:Uncharacterized protein n=1 Tax=Eruca vesicaria subsp. sativa TaxID=29727 RepID=A0ABC8M2V7_ERUVS|nr:unnamed protein product [Eruca vesicaria subsp. sativa]